MEYAIVTVRTEEGDWEADMELPAKMKLKNVALKVLETIKALDADRFESFHRLQFRYGNRILHEETTLADHQIWDGSILVIGR